MMKIKIFLKGKSVFAALFFCVLGLAAAPVWAEVRLARIFSEHMVLQRQKPIPIWGWANSNENVSVALAGQTKNASTDANGKWMVEFAPMEAGGPFELKISAG